MRKVTRRPQPLSAAKPDAHIVFHYDYGSFVWDGRFDTPVQFCKDGYQEPVDEEWRLTNDDWCEWCVCLQSRSLPEALTLFERLCLSTQED